MAVTISDAQTLGKNFPKFSVNFYTPVDRLPPVAVTLPDLSSMWDSERTIKIADRGYGMKREILKKVSCGGFLLL